MQILHGTILRSRHFNDCSKSIIIEEEDLKSRLSSSKVQVFLTFCLSFCPCLHSYMHKSAFFFSSTTLDSIAQNIIATRNQDIKIRINKITKGVWKYQITWCYGWNVCVPFNIHMLKPKAHCDSIERWGLWGSDWVMRVLPPWMWLGAIIKRLKALSALLAFHHVKTQCLFLPEDIATRHHAE